MPVIVAFFARQLLIIGVQLGIFALVEKYVVPLLNKAIEEIIQVFGVSEEDAQDILANEVIQTAEALGLTVALSKAKLPLKIAERLGFTSKGFSLRKLTGKAATAATTAKVAEAIDIKSLPIPLPEEATKLFSVLSSKWAKVGIVFGATMYILDKVFLGFIAFNNLIDFGNWNSGAYQKTFQKIFSTLTFGLLKPDEDYRKTKTTSPEVFEKIYNTYKINGAIAISNPFKGMSMVFSRNALLDLVDQVGATLLLTKGSASTKEVITATALYIVFSGEAVVTTPTPAAEPTISTPQIKVFTGVISQGTLGEKAEFTPRPNDLIETLDELQQSAIINLTEFIKSIAGRIVYEIKVVSTITTKDGFKQRGAVQQILVGYFKDGQPKYKTVINKFATIDIFIFTDRNIRTKISTIVLGPVDSAKLLVRSEQLQIVEQNLKDSLVTSDIGEVKSIQTQELVTITPPVAPAPVAPAPVAPAPVAPAPVAGNYRLYWSGTGNVFNEVLSDNAPTKADADRLARNRDPNFIDLGEFSAPTGSAGWQMVLTEFRNRKSGAAAPAVAQIAVAIPASNNPNKCNASTIANFFDINSKTYPTVAERAKLYEDLGLGQAAYYTGTAEQNLKLLPELKKRSGC